MTKGKGNFKEEIKKTDQLEEETLLSSDDKQLKEVIEGEKFIKTTAWGTLQLRQPEFGLKLKADELYVQFKTQHLLKGDLLTRRKMEIMYGKPLSIECKCGEKLNVGSGDWTDEDERKIQNLSIEISEFLDKFKVYRKKVQDIEEKITPDMKPEEVDTLIGDKERLLKEAEDNFRSLNEKRIESLSLYYRKYGLFSGCLEEMADLERCLCLAPNCIYKLDGTLLWNNKEELMKAGDEATKVFEIFRFFIRGVDVDFFGELLGDMM